MAFKAGEEIKEKKIYTGLASIKIKSICPSEVELATMGRKLTPYVDPEKKQVRIDVYYDCEAAGLENEKFSFFLTDEFRVSKTGKVQIIDDYGSSTWLPYVEGTEDLDYSKLAANEQGHTYTNKETARKAYNGEVALITFLRKWLNTGKDDVSKLDTLPKIFKGDFKELQDIVKAFGNKFNVQALLIEKGGYQNVYTNHFERNNSKNLKGWQKQLESADVNYQNSFMLKEFNPINAQPSPAPDGSMPDSNDLPF